MKPMLKLGNLAIYLTTYYHTTYLCKYSQNQVFLTYLVLNLGLTLSKVESKGHWFHHHPNLHKTRPHRLWVRLTILCPNVVIFFCDISFRLSCLAINDCSLKLALWISMLGMNFDARNVPILMLEMNFCTYNLEFQCLQSTLISS